MGPVGRPKKNLRVNSISPGIIVTPINKDLSHIADPEQRKQTEGLHLLGLGDPEDITNACNQFVNEVTLPLHTRLTDEDVEYVVGNFVEVIKS